MVVLDRGDTRRWQNMTMVEKRKGGIEISKLQCPIRDARSFALYIYIYLPTLQPFLNSVLSTQFNEEVKIHLA